MWSANATLKTYADTLCQSPYPIPNPASHHPLHIHLCPTMPCLISISYSAAMQFQSCPTNTTNQDQPKKKKAQNSRSDSNHPNQPPTHEKQHPLPSANYHQQLFSTKNDLTTFQTKHKESNSHFKAQIETILTQFQH